MTDYDNGQSLFNIEFLFNLSRAMNVLLCLLVGQLYGLEKFWAFLKYSRREVELDPKLSQWLSKYRRLEDFRVEVSHSTFFLQCFRH